MIYDVLILGGGPAGYVAAEHAGKEGMKVLLVEGDSLGGVCLNRGCIPTKAFLNSAKLYSHALHSGPFGVDVSGVAFRYDVMKARTEKIQNTLRNGIAAMMKRGKVEVVAARGVVLDQNRIEAGGAIYEGRNLILATGSRPARPPIPGIDDNPRVVDSTGLLAAESLSESLVVIGGGVIGIEFACFHALLGKKVTVLEMLPQICGPVDKEVAITIQRKLEANGASVHVNARVTRVEDGTVHFTDSKGVDQTVTAERALLATGRAPNLDGFGLETIGLDMDKRGVKVDDRARTSVPGVYAAGDVTGRMQLAHFASRQALVALANSAGRAEVCRENAVPAVIYTDPEAAGVGLTEAAARERGMTVRSAKMPLGASGRFLAETEGERGFVKAVFGSRNELLGMHVVGPYAGEMIGAACVMIENEMRAQDIREVVFPHPTVSEIMKEITFL